MFPHSRYESQQPLLPRTIEDQLVRSISRIGGGALLFVTGCVWLSLLTWSIGDPSLSNANGAVAQNALGSFGAIVSDLFLQTLGFTSVFVLLVPMFWGVALLLSGEVKGFRNKGIAYPLAALSLAGAFSSLPTLSGWPLNHGLGGIIGDAVFEIAQSIAQGLFPGFAGMLVVLALFVLGFFTLFHALGLERGDFAALLPARSTEAEPVPYNVSDSADSGAESYASDISSSTLFQDATVSQKEPLFDDRFPFAAAPLASQNTPPNRPQVQQAGSTLYPSSPVLGRAEKDPLPPIEELVRAPDVVPPQTLVRPEPQKAEASEKPTVAPQPPPVVDADDPIDRETAEMSRSIAERFAPVRHPQDPADPVPQEVMAELAGVPQSEPMQAVPPQARVSPSDPVLAPAAAVPVSAPQQSAPAPAVVAKTLPKVRKSKFKAPPLKLLKRAPSGSKAAMSASALRGTARLLEDVLNDFGIKGEIKDIKPGPVVTLFEFEPARGIKSSRVIALADDIARSMSATSARVAVVPGRNAIGIELSNPVRDLVSLRGLLEADEFRASEAALPITLGKSISGEPVVADLARMPHLLVAGTTGSGKSVGVNAMILSLLYRQSPDRCRMIMIDPKMLELSIYNDIPHLLSPVVTDPQKAVAALNWVVGEMEERYKRMSQLSVRNIDVYNNRVRNAQKREQRIARTVQTGFDPKSGQPIYETEELHAETMPYIVVVVDEFADLMAVAGKEIEVAVQRLAQMARAAGIHLIMATQRPSVDIITGTIKANFPTRISFRVTSKVDSRTILNEQGAEQLLGQGDMLFAAGSGQTTRVHGPFVSDEEVEAVAENLRSQGRPEYVTGVTEAAQDSSAPTQQRSEDLYEKAVALVRQDQKASTSYVQRRLSIGYNRAADLIERMERDGVISPAGRGGKREIF